MGIDDMKCSLLLLLAGVAVCSGSLLESKAQQAEKKGMFDSLLGGAAKAAGGLANAIAKKPEGWASVFREMTALQNEHEIEVTKLNQDFQMKYMKLQEQLSSQMSPMMMPPMMAGMSPMTGAMSMGAMQQPGSMFGAVPPLPPTPPAAPVYGAPEAKK